MKEHIGLYHRRLVETYGLLIEAVYDCKKKGKTWFLNGADIDEAGFGEGVNERRERLYGLALAIESWVDNNIDRENQFSDIRAPGLGSWDGDVIPDIWERIWAEGGPQENSTQWGAVALDYLNSNLERRK